MFTAFMRPDGFYWFENVPPGSYRLTARDDKDRHIVRDLVLPPGEDGKRPRVVEMDLEFTDGPPAEQPSVEPAALSVRPALPPARRGRAKTGR
jgi:hypothetical protein